MYELPQAKPAKPAREQFERTCCDCKPCRTGCYTMPAMLVPGDFERIAAHLGEQPDREFLLKHFVAGAGCEAVRINARTGEISRFAIQTITPDQQADGRCVFLDEAGHCTVHPVAPFGCAYFDSHQTAEEGNICASAGTREICADYDNRGPLFKLLGWLAEAGRRSRPLMERRRAFEQLHAQACADEPVRPCRQQPLEA